MPDQPPRPPLSRAHLRAEIVLRLCVGGNFYQAILYRRGHRVAETRYVRRYKQAVFDCQQFFGVEPDEGAF